MASLITSILSITQTITGQNPRFTPPNDCISKFTFEASVYNALPPGLLVRNALDNVPDSTCFPPYFAAFRRAPSSVQVYSPAACPSGYQTPVHIDNAGTTTEVCCESGFSYTSYYSSANYGNFLRLHLGCISTLTGSTVVPNRAMEYIDSTTTVSGPITMWAQPISVAYQQKDLSLFDSFSGGGSSTAKQTGTPSGSNSTPSSQASDSGLFTGAIVGIGVGIGAVMLILVAAAVVFTIHRKRQKQKLASQASPLTPCTPSSNYAKEMSGQAKIELPIQHHPRTELPDHSSVYEKSTDVSE